MSSAKDVIVVTAVLFAFALAFFTINFTAKTLVTNIMAVPAMNSSTNAVEAWEGINTTVDRTDYLFFGLFIALVLSTIITAWFVGGNPIFAFLYVLVLIISVPASAIFANVWSDFTTSSIFGTTINSFPITNHIITYLPFYTIAIAILGMVVLFSKPFVSRGV